MVACPSETWVFYKEHCQLPILAWLRVTTKNSINPNGREMSYLTRDQLDSYLKNLSTKASKPLNLEKSPASPTTVPPNSPLSPKPNYSTSPKTIPELESGSFGNPTSLESLTTPLVNINGVAVVPNKLPVVSTFTENSEPSSPPKKQYKNLDDIVNDLSYPLQTKLSFKKSKHAESIIVPSESTHLADNLWSSPKTIDDGSVGTTSPKVKNETKGTYVLSAVFRSNSLVSKSPDAKPLSRPSTKIHESPSSKSDSPPFGPESPTTQSTSSSQKDLIWDVQYNQALKKYPFIEELENKSLESTERTTPASNTKDEVEAESIKSDREETNSLRSNNSIEHNSSLEESYPFSELDGTGNNPSDDDSDINKSPISIAPITPMVIPKPNISEVCVGCGQRISGNILTAMGKQWHPEHFACKQCKIPLEHVAFFEKNGDPYCHLDYHELFSPRCGYCNTPIEGDCINALGKSWHNGHFFCRECGEPFVNGGFMVHDDFPYCKKDWVQKFAPKCKGCVKPINGEYVNAMDGKWHRECFVCRACEKPFNSSFFYVHNDKPYCDKHYRQLLTLAAE
ncbi:hypothetical protein G9A89_015934 [Geosiphon pyriformis]|nr:hypothetical protein G9A89_015934 [Geosiphon pyriformis]